MPRPILKARKLIPEARLPDKSNPYEDIYDVYSCEDKIVKDCEAQVISTGIMIEIPKGFYGRLVSPPDFSFDEDLEVGSSLLLSGFSQEVFVKVYRIRRKIVWVTHRNQNRAVVRQEEYKIEAGSRIAQLVINPCTQGLLTEVDNFERAEIIAPRHPEEGVVYISPPREPRSEAAPASEGLEKKKEMREDVFPSLPE